MKRYGNTFNSFKTEDVGVQRITVWKSAREFFPSGAFLAPADYGSVGLTESAVGTIVPALTPISVGKPGGKPTFNSATPDGLTYEDVELGTDGCTFTICTEGEALIDRTDATITEEQKKHLFGRIKCIKEL